MACLFGGTFFALGGALFALGLQTAWEYVKERSWSGKVRVRRGRVKAANRPFFIKGMAFFRPDQNGSAYTAISDGIWVVLMFGLQVESREVS